jgi:hypothetical protein
MAIEMAIHVATLALGARVIRRARARRRWFRALDSP